MNLNYNAIIREARTRADNRGLNLKFSTKDNAWSDAYTLSIRKPHPMWDDQQWAVWWYEFESELGAHDPDIMDFYTMLNKTGLQLDTFMGGVTSMLESHRQERHKYSEYLGRKRRLETGRRMFTEQVSKENNFGQSGDQHRDALEALWAWDVLNREDWQPSLGVLGEQVLKQLTPQQQEWVDKLSAGNYGAALKSNPTADEVYDLSKRIIDEVFPFDAEEEEQSACKPQQGDGEQEEGQENGDSQGQGSEGEGDSSGTGHNDGSGEGQGVEQASGSAPRPDNGDDNDGRGESGTAKVGRIEADDKDRITAGGTVNYSDLMQRGFEPDTKKRRNVNGQGLHINYDTEGTANFNPQTVDKYNIFNYADGSQDAEEEGTWGDNYIGMIDNIIEDTVLHKRIRRLLQTKVATRYQHALKRGKVSSKSIYRAGLGKDAGESGRKVFKKKQQHDELDVVFSIVVDCSGSMAGDKFAHAGASAVMFAEALAALNIPVEIVGFDWGRRTVEMAIWKTFQKRVGKEELTARIADSASHLMSGNSDGESIMWAFDRLARQKQKRKILVVLSDGSPAGGHGNAKWYTKKVIEEIEKGGIAEIYGIGIMDYNVTKLYKKHRVINRVDELEDAVLGVIKDKVIDV